VGGVPQSVKPEAAQVGAQVPSLQTSPPVHRLPHEPQFLAFDERSTQFPVPPKAPAHCV
jgi:hypothetical protein